MLTFFCARRCRTFQSKKARLPLLMGLIVAMCLLGGAQAEAKYRSKAIEATNYIQRTFFVTGENLYAPQDPPKEKGLEYDFIWPHGVQFTALAAATRHEPERYSKSLLALAAGLERYWDNNVDIPGFDVYHSSDAGNDKYYDANARLALAFIEAYETTKDKRFLDWAQSAQNFALSGWDDKLDGGIYWHQSRRISKNATVNAAAAAASAELYRISNDKEDLEWAQRIYQWIGTKLQDTDGLLWDNIKMDGNVERVKWTYNTGLMIHANISLWRAVKDDKYLTEARRLADASLQQWVNAQTGAFADGAGFNHVLADALLMVYEETKDLRYLNAVRRHADFTYRYLRDEQNGGYWSEWKNGKHEDNEAKTLMDNASAARLFWLLAPYLDVEELKERSEAATRDGDTKTALSYTEQAAASTAGAPPTATPQ
jgi:uncharacterized protein YyaL (SSP411 family)